MIFCFGLDLVVGMKLHLIFGQMISYNNNFILKIH